MGDSSGLEVSIPTKINQNKERQMQLKKLIIGLLLLILSNQNICVNAKILHNEASELAQEKNDLSIVPKDATKGDFNGDGVLDYAWLVPPKKSKCKDCDGKCTSYIKFSDKSIPSIKVEMCIGGTPTNLGDLNKNASDEIGILPDWCTSCWSDYNVYTLKNRKWIFAVDPFPTHCIQWEDGIKPIEIDLNKEGNVIIRYSEMTDEDIVVKTKSVPTK